MGRDGVRARERMDTSRPFVLRRRMIDTTGILVTITILTVIVAWKLLPEWR
jgi:hypothetical protein